MCIVYISLKIKRLANSSEDVGSMAMDASEDSAMKAKRTYSEETFDTMESHQESLETEISDVSKTSYGTKTNLSEYHSIISDVNK